MPHTTLPASVATEEDTGVRARLEVLKAGEGSGARHADVQAEGLEAGHGCPVVGTGVGLPAAKGAVRQAAVSGSTATRARLVAAGWRTAAVGEPAP
jgi:hypothetical protein